MSRLYRKMTKEVNSGLDGLSSNGITTIFAKPFQNLSINIIIVKRMLKITGEKGIYLSLRRSHRHLKGLIKRTNLDPKRLIFIDAVHGISGLQPNEGAVGKNVKMVECPFSDSFLTVLLRQLRMSARRKGVRFLVVDDLQALSCYMDHDKLLWFIEDLIECIKKTKLDKSLIIVDSMIEPGIRAFIEMASEDFLEVY